MIAMCVLGLVVLLATLPRLGSAELVFAPFIVYGVLGVRLTGVLPRNPIGWVFLFVGVMTTLAVLAEAGIDHALAVDDLTAWWAVLAAWVYGWFWYPLSAAAIPLTLLLFPDGLPSPRWRWILGLWLLVVAGATLVAMQAPTLYFGDDDAPQVINPIGVADLDSLEAPFSASLLVLIVTALAAPVVRARHANPVERMQLRWFATAAVIWLLWIPVVEFVLPDGDSVIGDVGFAAVLSCFPIACAVAITRYRLYDIDRIISRTASYVIVTALVLGTYAVVVTAVTRLLPTSSTLAVAAATLVAAAVARPLLRRVQGVVDRRFNRSRYDAERTVEAFGERLRTEIAADDVMVDLAQVVRSTLEPKGVSLWLASR